MPKFDSTPLPFYLPRRHRRKLLFPPGLLALAGLLWVGCIVLSTQSERLKRYNVMQLTMPPFYKTEGSPLYGAGSPFAMTAQKLNTFRPWHDASFIGKDKADAQEEIRLINIVRAVMTNTRQNGGVRVRFAETARYKYFVFVINLMNRENIKKYWFDIRSKPISFYAYTNRHNPDSEVICNAVCGNIKLTHENTIPVPFWTRFDNSVTDFWKLTWIQPLLSPEWRISTWLLAVVATLSIRRIIRARYPA